MWMWVEFSDYNTSQFEFVQYVPRFFSGKHILAPFASILKLFVCLLNTRYMYNMWFIQFMRIQIYALMIFKEEDFFGACLC